MPVLQRSRVAYRGMSWESLVFDHKKVLHNYLIPPIENTVANKINAAPNAKVGCNTVENITDFLYFDWLYFLWHGIKSDISIIYQ